MRRKGDGKGAPRVTGSVVGGPCPLCKSSGTSRLKTFEIGQLTKDWQTGLGIDIREQMRGECQLELRACGACRLQFFLPSTLVGSPALYTALEKIDWYYIARKWEHDVALGDLRGSQRGLEVGSGFGAFVERALAECKDFEGLESNPSAVDVARSRGLPVQDLDLEPLSRSRKGQYDVVCSFQVLEHVAEPARFIDCCANLLRPGGKLMLGLPNAKSFLKYQFNLLDMPPHHMTRWSDEVLNHIPHYFPLRLERLAYEPLPEYQVRSYVTTYASFLAERGLRPLASRVLQRRLERVVRSARVRKFLRGQTLYALYTRL
jgi:SAM-dependent methyltransferase